MSAVDRVVEAVAAFVRGWWLVALVGKRPVADGWSTAPRAMREQVECWAEHDNVGVRCGESGLVVIDDDTADHSAATTLGLPPTWTVITGSGGRHHYFDAGLYAIRNSASKLAEKVDVRAQGGQCVLPGGVHPETGESYRWAPGFSPNDLPLASLPAEIAARLARTTSRRGRGESSSIPDAARARRYAEAALKSECDHVAATGEGARNDRLVRSAFSLGQLVGAGALAHAEVVAGLESAARRCGLPDDEASRTIASGLKAGEAEPRDMGDIAADEVPSANSNGAAQPRRRILLPTIPTYVPFPTDALPEPIAGAIVAHSAAIGCDAAFVALPMLSALAAAIGNSRRIRLKQTWSEPAIVWAVPIADSGQQKSPGFRAATANPRAVQRDKMREHEDAQAAFLATELRYQAALSDWKRKSSRAHDPPAKPEAPRAERIIVQDATVEALAPLLRDAPRGLLLARDELSGWLRSFDAYKSGRGGDVAHWLEWFHGQESLVDRKGSGTTYIERASLSVCGTIQPSVLRVALGMEHFADGLAARLLLAMPPRTPHRWRDATVTEEVARAVDGVFGRLRGLEMRDGGPIDVDLTPDARRAFIDFYNSHGVEMDALTGDLAACWSKLEGYCARFALILHLVRVAAGDHEAGEGDEIAEQDVVAAVRVTRWFCGESARVYGVLAETPAATDRRDLIELIRRRGGSITARNLRRANRRFTTTEAAAASLAQLVEDGIADWVDVTPGDQGGRPTRTCRLREHVDGADVDESPELRRREEDGGST